MRPLFEQLTATMLMGISKVQVRWHIVKIFWECFCLFRTYCRLHMHARTATSFTSRHLCLEVIRYEQFRIPKVLREFTKFCWEMSFFLCLSQVSLRTIVERRAFECSRETEIGVESVWMVWCCPLFFLRQNWRESTQLPTGFNKIWLFSIKKNVKNYKNTALSLHWGIKSLMCI